MATSIHNNRSEPNSVWNSALIHGVSYHYEIICIFFNIRLWTMYLEWKHVRGIDTLPYLPSHPTVIRTLHQMWSVTLLGDEAPTPASFILSAALIKSLQDFHKFKASRREKPRRPLTPVDTQKSWRHVSLWMVRRIRVTPCQALGSQKSLRDMQPFQRQMDRARAKKKWRQAVGKWQSNTFRASNVQ